MKVIADLSIVPIGVGVTLSPYVAACEKEEQSGTDHDCLHSSNHFTPTPSHASEVSAVGSVGNLSFR